MVDSSAAKTGRLDTPRSSYDVAVDVRDAHLERGTFSLRIGELRIRRGECVALIGPSGSGKTTLLEMIAGVLPSTSGELIVAGQPLSALSESQRRRFRAGRIGMVFQEFELLEYLHVRDNVLLPFRLQPGSPIAAANWRRADDLLEAAGLGDKLLRPVRRLSQGERQRVAICRAMVRVPEIVLADEPTGSLDPDNKQAMLQWILETVRREDATLVLATHDHALLPQFDRVLEMASLAGSAEP